MATRIADSLDRLTHADLIGVVRDLIGEVGRLRAENEKLGGALTKLKAEHQAVKDELARLKNLPPRPAKAFRYGEGHGARRVVLRPALGGRRQERRGREAEPPTRQPRPARPRIPSPQGS